MKPRLTTNVAEDANVIPVYVNAGQGEEAFETIQQSIHEKSFQLFLKRVFDIIAALTLIILFAPVLITVALLIKCTSRGPVLYSKDRVGYGGVHFKCHKFRSMIADHSGKRHEQKCHLEKAEKGVLHKDKNDLRVTWIGKIIRRTSIDELPQLFNVLLGDMSIVGPRPLVPFMLVPYPEFKEVRCLVRPGITGLWQIRDRANNTSAAYMISHDTQYIADYTFLLDMKILMQTPIVVLSGKGAY
ncbi:sugar transferase [Parafilimonas sp.]|uniref:sugar transferase n=1 Tax=Parafilimonas sp. TaxID=1969739 RepID=UPI0039E58DCC